MRLSLSLLDCLADTHAEAIFSNATAGAFNNKGTIVLTHELVRYSCLSLHFEG